MSPRVQGNAVGRAVIFAALLVVGVAAYSTTLRATHDGVVRLGSGPASHGATTVPDAATLARGASIYERCAACHAIDRNRTGPQHCGLFGRRAGTAPGFGDYSAAMRTSGIVWSAQTLDRFLRNPAALVPGTTMGYAGIADASERADLIAWLGQATRSCKPQS